MFTQPRAERKGVDTLRGAACFPGSRAGCTNALLATESRLLFLPLALVGRDFKWVSPADNDLFALRARSRLRTLWTLWRASKTLVPRTQRSA
jgi:phytoene synthase